MVNKTENVLLWGLVKRVQSKEKFMKGGLAYIRETEQLFVLGVPCAKKVKTRRACLRDAVEGAFG